MSESCLVLAIAAVGGQASLYALGANLAVRHGGATLLDLSLAPLPGALPPDAPTLAAVLGAGEPVASAPTPYQAEPRLKVLPGGPLGPAQILGGVVTVACHELLRSGAALVLAPALHAELLRELFPSARAAVFAGSGGLEAVLDLRRTVQTLQELLPPTALALLAPPEGDGVTLTASQVAEWLRPLQMCRDPGEAAERIASGTAGGGSARVALERLRRMREQEQEQGAVAPAAATVEALSDDPEEAALLKRVLDFCQRRRRLQRLRREAEALAEELATEAAELQRALSL